MSFSFASSSSSSSVAEKPTDSKKNDENEEQTEDSNGFGSAENTAYKVNNALSSSLSSILVNYKDEEEEEEVVMKFSWQRVGGISPSSVIEEFAAKVEAAIVGFGKRGERGGGDFDLKNFEFWVEVTGSDIPRKVLLEDLFDDPTFRKVTLKKKEEMTSPIPQIINVRSPLSVSPDVSTKEEKANVSLFSKFSSLFISSVSSSSSSSSTSSSSSSSLCSSSNTGSLAPPSIGAKQGRRRFCEQPGMNAAGASQARFMQMMDANNNLNDSAASSNRLTADDVKQHNTATDAWVILRSKVFNITPYLDFHPGGRKILLAVAGKDCTAQFNKYHPWVNADYLLNKLCVGTFVRHKD